MHASTGSMWITLPQLSALIMVPFRSGCGMPVIDDNRRAAQDLGKRYEVFAFVLDEAETLELLHRSMGYSVADHYWERIFTPNPPNDIQEGER